MVHDVGGLVYYDGANLNAILGVARPGDMGFDIVHSNLHKTFATPHGGGGPGAGPVAVVERLWSQFLPGPLPAPRRRRTSAGRCPQRSIGRVHGRHGNFLVVVRALTYMRALGGPGLRRVAERSVLNARYLASLLSAEYDLPYRRPVHARVRRLGRRPQAGRTGVRAMDVAKALLDLGFHAPTMYFPLDRRRGADDRTDRDRVARDGRGPGRGAARPIAAPGGDDPDAVRIAPALHPGVAGPTTPWPPATRS